MSTEKKIEGRVTSRSQDGKDARNKDPKPKRAEKEGYRIQSEKKSYRISDWASI